MKHLATALLVLAIVATLVGVWWWALLGMKGPVGAAITATVTVLAVAGFVAGVASTS